MGLAKISGNPKITCFNTDLGSNIGYIELLWYHIYIYIYIWLTNVTASFIYKYDDKLLDFTTLHNNSKLPYTLAIQGWSKLDIS
jgi:hypothetical protein